MRSVINRMRGVRRENAPRIFVLVVVATCWLVTATPAHAALGVLGQPDLASKTRSTRCADNNARFNYNVVGPGDTQYGPAGVAVGSEGRLFVTDDAGGRVLSWPDTTSLQACQPADVVIGKGLLVGPSRSPSAPTVTSMSPTHAHTLSASFAHRPAAITS